MVLMKFIKKFPLPAKTVSVVLVVIMLIVFEQELMAPVYADVSPSTQTESGEPNDNLGYLFAVFFLTWVAFFGYIFFLSRRLVGLKSELEELKSEIRKRDSSQS